jgi:hypothetical protein
VAFDLALMNNIPANVKVACSYQDQYCEYINSADSSGSPYTVEVGAGINVDNYIAKDSENRICFTSTNQNTTIQNAINTCSNDGLVYISDGNYSNTLVTVPTGVTLEVHGTGINYISTGGKVYVETPESTSTTINTETGLNAKLLSSFATWQNSISRYTSINGTLVDPYDFSQSKAGTTITTLSGVSPYTYSLVKLYQETNDLQYLTTARTIIDQYISESFYTYTDSFGTINYIPQYWYNDVENDEGPLQIMYAATASLLIYQATGNTTYKNFADAVAYQSLNILPVINNSTDLAFTPGYYTPYPATETNAKLGVNRQCSTAVFYSYYSTYNSSYADYVPRLLNWAWRSQLENGGCTYNIGDATVNNYYTAYSLAMAMQAYANVPDYFDAELIASLTESVDYLFSLQTSNAYLTAPMTGTALAMAIKTGFYTPTDEQNQLIESYISYTIDTLQFGINGLQTAFEDPSFGFRWEIYTYADFFAIYPLPTALNTETYSPLLSYYQEGRYWISQPMFMGGISQQYINTGDSYGQVGYNSPYPFMISAIKGASGTRSNDTSIVNGIIRATANYTTNPTASVTYFYPANAMYSSVTGSSSAYIYSALVSGVKVVVSNGTVYNISDLSNGTVVLSADFELYRDGGTLETSNLLYVRCTAAESVWTLLKSGTSYFTLTASVSDYNITTTYLAQFTNIGNYANAHSMLQNETNLIYNAHILDAPLTYTQLLNWYKAELTIYNPLATWQATYSNAGNSFASYINNDNPEASYLLDYSYNFDTLKISYSAKPTTTQIYWQPTQSSPTVQGGSFVYDSVTKLLTIIPNGNCVIIKQ